MRRIMVVAVLMLGACGGADEQGAGIACEDFVRDRLGVDVDFASHMEANREELGGGRWLVQSTYTEPATSRIIDYRCEVEQIEGGWRLRELEVDR